MADYALGVLVNGQTIVTNQYNAANLRRQMPTVFQKSLQNQRISIPDAQALRVSPLRPVDVNYMSFISPGSATAKAYNHTGTQGNSGKTSVTYLQTVETFSLARKMGYNNIITYQQMFNNQYEQAWKNLHTRQDNLALAFLYANRNQLSAGVMSSRLASAGLGAYWDDTNFALALPAATNPLFIANLKGAMASSLYTGQYDVICDIQMAIQFENYMNQGTGNFSNTNWQFADCNLTRTQVSIDSAFPAGATLALPKGAFAGLCWNEGLNVKGVFEDAGGSVGILTTMADPFGSGAVADLSMYTQRADTSSNTTGGSPEDIVDQWELTLTMGYTLSPLDLDKDSTCLEVSRLAAVS